MFNVSFAALCYHKWDRDSPALEKEYAHELLYRITMTDAFLFRTQVLLGKANERGVFLRSQMRESSDRAESAWDTKIYEGIPMGW